MKTIHFTTSLCFALSLLCAGCKIPKSSYTTAKAPVLRVFSASDAGHSFVAYVVDRGGVEVVVSDALGKSRHKVGDTIEYMEMKIEVDPSNRVLSFTLAN